MNDINAQLRKEGALRGLLFGAILLVIDIALIYYTAYMAQSPGVFFVVSFVFSFILQIGLAVWFTAGLRKKTGGYWTLKQGVTGIFVMLMVTYLLSGIGRWAFSSYGDTATVKKANEQTLVIQRSALQTTGQPAANIEKSLATTRNAIKESQVFNLAHMVQNLLFSIILIFAVSAILGALFKREPPIFSPITEGGQPEKV